MGLQDPASPPGSLLRPAAFPYSGPVLSEPAAVALAWFRCHKRARSSFAVALKKSCQGVSPPPSPNKDALSPHIVFVPLGLEHAARV